ncbi:MAG: hypothetical protein ACYTG6_05995 [Planctomycetota bacterium]|jgi:tetratricopeptide (TPR) repeat protein
MIHRILGATIALGLALLLTPSPACADILDQTDGSRLPSDPDILTKWGEVPTDEDLEESRNLDLELAYDVVGIGRGRTIDAALVKEFWISDTRKNQDYNAGELYGERGYWVESADAFAAAAEELTGAAKQVALYKRMLALSYQGDPESTLAAADAVLVAFPKSYYLGPVQELRARIFASQGKTNEAVAALRQITSAEGMNARDYFNAEYMRLWLTRFISASTPQQFAVAERSFRDLLQEIERHPKRAHASEPKLKAQLSLAGSLRFQGKTEEALKLYQQILNASDEATDKALLAGVYYGLGDAAFERAANLQGEGGDKEQVKSLLETASLHYLRVVLLYGDFADMRDLYGATRGAARVFASLFQLTDDTDCDLARRAYDFYRRAVGLQERGEERRSLVREGKALKTRMDAACGGAEGDETEDGED